MIEQNFIRLYQDSFREHWALPALTNYDTKESYTYGEMAADIARRHLLFERIGLKPGDKVALLGKDSAEWCMAFMSVITYGAIIVPVLPDFNAADAASIVTHSDAKYLFVSDKIWETMDPSQLLLLCGAVSIRDYTVFLDRTEGGLLSREVEGLSRSFSERYPSGFTAEDIRYAEVSNDDLILLNYTSGTTGFSKGVMLRANNLAGNVTYVKDRDIMFRGETILCFLPLAHTYSCAFNFLTPLTIGVHVYILGKIPSPLTLIKAFADVRPSFVIMVPLIIEKLYHKAIAPKIKTPLIKFLLRLPVLKKVIHKSIRSKLIESFGGNFRQIIIGGAALNDEVAHFLYRIGFPLTVGYGMTECGPLISYEDHSLWLPGSCGKSLSIMEVRIDHSGQERHSDSGDVGEIQVRGENVCLGYYKNAELTAELFTPDGWMRTGDLGTIDSLGNIFIKGRSKTMLLGSNGQNIYPEEIESKINNLSYVLESIVTERDGRLIALIVPDRQAIEHKGISPDQAWAYIERSRAELNGQVGAYEKITAFVRHDEEFEKTPKHSIKRFLYT
ncbi:long-chain fatty acid--CoA ligase [Porphyromonas gingivalis]|uniref:AMP-binding protein n=1 Tax=Porphyromonas gingivalis TaxID=837 RepID=UPI000BE71C10|nr:AMP-binding protein [Porphyromonas gingivalis]PDP82930.1 long-chain fatty acid--CoA ligase [Porphyromonas gingivalis]